MSQLGNAVSAARFAMNPTPLGALGLIGGLGFGGKSKKSRGGIPGGTPGNYTLNNKPYDTSRYEFSTDKGKYNLIPYLNPVSATSTTDYSQGLGGVTKYTPGQSPTDRVLNLVKDDPQAKAYIDKTFGSMTTGSAPPPNSMLAAIQSPIPGGKMVYDFALRGNNEFSGSNLQNNLTFDPANAVRTADFSRIMNYAKKQNHQSFSPLAAALYSGAPKYQSPNASFQSPNASYRAPSYGANSK